MNLSNVNNELKQHLESFLQNYARGCFHYNEYRKFNNLYDVIKCLEECKEIARPFHNTEGIYKYMYSEANQILNKIYKMGIPY